MRMAWRTRPASKRNVGRVRDRAQRCRLDGQRGRRLTKGAYTETSRAFFWQRRRALADLVRLNRLPHGLASQARQA
jgi:hypothetical protein